MGVAVEHFPNTNILKLSKPSLVAQHVYIIDAKLELQVGQLMDKVKISEISCEILNWTIIRHIEKIRYPKLGTSEVFQGAPRVSIV